MTLAEQIKQVMELDEKRPSARIDYVVTLKQFWDDAKKEAFFNSMERSCQFHNAASIIRQLTDIVKTQHEALEHGCLWVKEMREGVNKWAGSIEMCGVQARQENLDSWANKTRGLLALSAPIVKEIV